MKIFHKTSEFCYNWINGQPFVKEESITDWLLYYISQNSKKVIYKTFSRNEEAFNGTDWEWWILTPKFAYRFIIQAKKLKPNGQDNYPGISYSNRNGMQIDLLLKSAEERNAMPLYAFYSCQKPDINEQIGNISFVDKNILRWCETCTNGCFLSSAFWIQKNIFEKPKRKITDTYLINASFGISILDYDYDYDSQDINISDDILFNISREYKNRFNFRNLPVYVNTLIEYRNNIQSLSWFENEFSRDLNSLSGVSIIDLRKS